MLSIGGLTAYRDAVKNTSTLNFKRKLSMEKRRSFLKKSYAVGAGAAVLASEQYASAESKSTKKKSRTFKRKTPRDLVEVGMVVAHGCHSYNIWAKNMNPPEALMRHNNSNI